MDSFGKESAAARFQYGLGQVFKTLELICLVWWSLSVLLTTIAFTGLALGGTGAALWPRLWPAARTSWLWGFGISLSWLTVLRYYVSFGWSIPLSDPYWWGGQIFYQFALLVGIICCFSGTVSGFPWFDPPGWVWFGLVLGQGATVIRWLLGSISFQNYDRVHLSSLPLLLVWLMGLGLIGSVWLPMRGALQQLPSLCAFEAISFLLSFTVVVAVAELYGSRPLSQWLSKIFGWLWPLALVAGLGRQSGGPWPYLVGQIGGAFRFFWVVPGLAIFLLGLSLRQGCLGQGSGCGGPAQVLGVTVMSLGSGIALFAITGLSSLTKWIRFTWAELAIDLFFLHVICGFGFLLIQRLRGVERGMEKTRALWCLLVPVLVCLLTGIWHGITEWMVERPWQAVVAVARKGAVAVGLGWIIGSFVLIGAWQNWFVSKNDSAAMADWREWMVKNGGLQLGLQRFRLPFSYVPALLLAWAATVGLCHWKWGSLTPAQDNKSLRLYPEPLSGRAKDGAMRYRQHGCAECHTRVGLSPTLGPDWLRGWISRPSVLRDYLFEEPAVLGWVRIGPDLANYGKHVQGLREAIERLWDVHGKENAAGLVRYPGLFVVARSPQQARWIDPNCLIILPEKVDQAGVYAKEEAVAIAEFLRSLSQEALLKETARWQVGRQ